MNFVTFIKRQQNRKIYKYTVSLKNMTETEYGIVTAKRPEFTPRDLLVVPHEGGSLTTSYPAFGPNYFRKNVVEMNKSYSHPQTGERISFREPTTSESISASAYDFENMAKPKIFGPRWLQAGYIVRTQDGVFVNPPKDTEGNPIVDESALKCYINGIKPVKVGRGNIYVVPNRGNLRDFGFANYNSFERGTQDCETFSQGGLARVLEHTEGSTKNLQIISSPLFYKNGVNVYGFDKVREPVLRVVSLDSARNLGGDRLYVDGLNWNDDNYGYAFGVFPFPSVDAEGVAPKK